MPELQARIAAASALFLFALALPSQPLSVAQAQVGIPPNVQVGPTCVGDPHHVQVDTITVDLNRTCVTVTIRDPDGDAGVDADTLDGLDSLQFLRADVSGTLTGSLTVTGDLAAGGEVTLGNSGALCTAAKAGAQRYDSGAKELVFCDGVSWRRVGLPAGAVEAFDLATCPAGWTAYTAAANRNIIGIGTYTLGQTGGEATHTLTTAEMPSHSHTERIPTTQSSTLVVASASDAPGGSRYSVQPSGGAADGGDLTTGNTGSGTAHNVLDPYVALLYCKKL
jgi:hypothetical protein